jgi:hypothetical protein
MSSKQQQRMPEAEVSLRLAFWLIERGYAVGPVDVAIDGAQLQVRDKVHFDLVGFMARSGWVKRGNGQVWQGDWVDSNGQSCIRIHSNPGRSDVVAHLNSGKSLRVECKKGPLVRSQSSQEYPLLREALGQLLTVAEVGVDDLLAVAVPDTPKFRTLAQRWRNALLIARFGIRILTVDRVGHVYGFPEQAG